MQDTTLRVLVEDDSPIVIGVRANGTPIYELAGSTASTIDDWIPIEYDDEVVQRVLTDSVIERYAARVPMTSKTKSIPRSSGITVTAGTTYTDSDGANDEVTITARRFIARIEFDEDDMSDAETRMDVIGTKGMDWAISYADTFDCACLGTSAAANGTTIPFNSVYYVLRTSDSDVEPDYTADDNYLTWDDDYTAIASTPDGTSLYEKLSALFKLVETGKYWSQADALVIAHPGWRDALRVCTDAQGRPIFIAGTSGNGGATPDMLFNTPIAWSRGARISATATDSPTGADLLFYVNRRFLKRGDRSGPETLMDEARAQDDSDNFAIKFRTRRGFVLTHPNAAAVLVRVTD
jgi:hypothetical protein